MLRRAPVSLSKCWRFPPCDWEYPYRSGFDRSGITLNPSPDPTRVQCALRIPLFSQTVLGPNQDPLSCKPPYTLNGTASSAVMW